MLVSNNLNNQVVVLKMNTGEEVIARSGLHDLDGSIMIKNPLSMVMVPSEDGKQANVAFTPWMLALEDDEFITIPKSAFICLFKARRDAAMQYSEALGEQEELSNPVLHSAAPSDTTARKGGRGR